MNNGNNSLSRRKFIREASVTVVGALGIGALLSACGSGSGYGGGANNVLSGGNCNQNGSQLETTGVTDSHTHTIQITAAEIVAANPNAVFTTSDVGHTHTVQLTAQQYATLQSNIGVQLETGPGGGDAHVHSLTINCA